MEEYLWKSYDGIDLYARSWKGEDKPKAVICLVHGMGEHSGRYYHLGEFFANRNISVLAMDLRGHGQSMGKRGHTKDYQCLIQDIDILIEKAKEIFPDIPRLIYGHSLGGNLVLSYSFNRPHNNDPIIITSPWIKLSFEPARIKVLLAKMLGGLLPGFSQKTGLNPDHLSANPSIGADYVKDTLVHDKITVSMYLGILKAGSEILSRNDLGNSCLILHGTEDKITSWKASKEFSSNNTTVEIKLWPDNYHELHNEDNRDDIMEYTYNWINSRI